MTILIILGVIFYTLTFIGAAKSEKDDIYITLFVVSLTALSLLMMLIGIKMEENIWEEKTQTKELVVPTVKIECIDGQCDTLYVYEFKNKL
jgi:hypothetical protein